MRGRKPKPTHLRIVEGNRGHRPINENEIQPEGDLNEAPAEFSPYQRRLWHAELAKCPDGLLRRLDQGAFASYITNYATVLEATAAINKMGHIIRTKKTQSPQVNPWLSIRSRANDAMMKAIAELGFSPTSRTRVKTVGSSGRRKATQDGFGSLQTFE